MTKRMNNSYKTEERVFKAVVGVWIASILATIAFWGVVIWGLIKLVNHFAG